MYYYLKFIFIIVCVFVLFVGTSNVYSQEKTNKKDPFPSEKVDLESKSKRKIFSLNLKKFFLNEKNNNESRCEAAFIWFDECKESCNTIANRQLDQLPCNFDQLRREYYACDDEQRENLGSCYDMCEEIKVDRIKRCREDKKTEIKDCSDSYRVLKDICDTNKSASLLSCRSLRGRAKRRCKKNVKKIARDCRKEAREFKRTCKKDARRKKRYCIRTAEENRKICSDRCGEMHTGQCGEEESAFNACGRLRNEVLASKEACIKECEETRDLLLESCDYSPSCPNDEGGDAGTDWTLHNTNTVTYHLYRPNQFSHMEEFATIAPNNTITVFVDCGMLIPYIAKVRQIDGSHSVGHSHALYGDCCKEKTEKYLSLY